MGTVSNDWIIVFYATINKSCANFMRKRALKIFASEASENFSERSIKFSHDLLPVATFAPLF
jgi:hypothetical protein